MKTLASHMATELDYRISIENAVSALCKADKTADVAFVLQIFGHVSAHDTESESLGDGCFADARFTDKNRVVLGAATQDLEDTTDFIVTPDHGIQLAAPCTLIQIDGVLLEVFKPLRLCLILSCHSCTNFSFATSESKSLPKGESGTFCQFGR